MKRLLLISTFLWTLSPSLVLAAPRSVKVTAQNMSSFEQIAAGQPYYCFTSGAVRRLGTVTKNRLRPRSKWTPYSTSKLEKSISSLSKEILKLERKGRTNTSKYRQSVSKRQAVSVQLASMRQLMEQCEAGPQLATPLPPAIPATPSPSLFSGIFDSIAPYQEQLFPAEVEHLLNKVALGGTAELRQIGNTRGLSALVDALVDGIELDNSEAALEQLAGHWIDVGFYRPENEPGKKQWTIWAAQWGQFVRNFYSRNPLREYLALLLHGQFATNLGAINFAFNDSKQLGIPEHIERLRRQALGNFLHLSQEMVYDRAMSEWLNNNDNHIGAPNQNFGREFLELFVLGAIDPISGAANYDEQSVVAATGYFSGFQEKYQRPMGVTTGPWEMKIVYNEDLHDPTVRTVFQGIPGAELTAALDWMQFPAHVLTNHPNSARYVVERLFAQLVHPNVSEHIVQELAADFRGSGFMLKPILKKILKSNAMFSQAAVKPCIASPVEWTSRLYRKLVQTPLPTSGPLAERSQWLLWGLVENHRNMGQIPFEPPSVFGWKGACGVNRAGTKAYGEGFLSAQRVLNRDRACSDLVNSFLNLEYDFRTLFPSTSLTPEQIVRHLATNIFNLELTPDQAAILVRFLMNDRNEQNQLQPFPFTLATDWMVKKKIPRLICLLQGFLDSNLR